MDAGIGIGGGIALAGGGALGYGVVAGNRTVRSVLAMGTVPAADRMLTALPMHLAPVQGALADVSGALEKLPKDFKSGVLSPIKSAKAITELFQAFPRDRLADATAHVGELVGDASKLATTVSADRAALSPVLRSGARAGVAAIAGVALLSVGGTLLLSSLLDDR